MHKDFLDIIDYSPQELLNLLDLAIRLKEEYAQGGNEPVLKGKVLAMIFQKPSLRTRVSFDMAMRHLGGDALYLSPNEVGLGNGNLSLILPVYLRVMCKASWHAYLHMSTYWS